MKRNALLINPWIYDFAAFDMWAFPLGLLSLSSLLKKAGWNVTYIDCTDRHHPSIIKKVPREKYYHQGKYYAEVVEKPEIVSFVPRYYRRYGIPEDAFVKDLEDAETPDVILVSSRMTYWYPGVKRAIEIMRDIFPGVPIILGGIYASFCTDHAKKVCKPDIVFSGEAEADLFQLIEKATGISSLPIKEETIPDLKDLNTLPFPDYEILRDTKALPLESSRGCPFQCTYCASGKLVPGFRRKGAERVVDEIEFAVEKLGTEDFAFYDDALLFKPGEHFEKIALEYEKRNIKARFHTPNSIFASELTPFVAEKMKQMDFRTVRISLETTNVDRLKKMNRKIFPEHFKKAMKNLANAGFTKKEIGVYIMAGLPGQEAQEVRDAIDFTIELGGIPHLAEYSPIPGTVEWERAKKSVKIDITGEPLFQNNTVFHLLEETFEQHALEELKHYLWKKAKIL